MGDGRGPQRIRLRELFARPTAALPPGQRAVEAFPPFGILVWTRPSIDELRLEIVASGTTRVLDQSALAAFARHEQVADFHCVAGWTRRDLRWEGVTVRDLWDAIITELAPPDATHFRFVGADGFRATLPLEDALADGVMVADRLDGEALDADHGAPLRLVAPAHYGYKNVKYLCRLEVHVGEPDDLPLPRWARPPFRILRPHPRARVAYRERHRRLSARRVETAYRLLVPLFVRLSRERPRHRIQPPNGAGAQK